MNYIKSVLDWIAICIAVIAIIAAYVFCAAGIIITGIWVIMKIGQAIF